MAYELTPEEKKWIDNGSGLVVGSRLAPEAFRNTLMPAGERGGCDPPGAPLCQSSDLFIVLPQRLTVRPVRLFRREVPAHDGDRPCPLGSTARFPSRFKPLSADLSAARVWSQPRMSRNAARRMAIDLMPLTR